MYVYCRCCGRVDVVCDEIETLNILVLWFPSHCMFVVVVSNTCSIFGKSWFQIPAYAPDILTVILSLSRHMLWW